MRLRRPSATLAVLASASVVGGCGSGLASRDAPRASSSGDAPPPGVELPVGPRVDHPGVAEPDPRLTPQGGMMRTDKLTWLSRVLSLAGLGIAAYLTNVYLQDLPPACFGDSHGCATVQHSSYAHLAGIPLPVFGLIGYAALSISACLPGQRARAVGMAFTMIAIAASIVLTYLELNVIHAICYWCVASAICASFHVVVNSMRCVRGEPLGASRERALCV